jgi:hypothetical protein
MKKKANLYLKLKEQKKAYKETILYKILKGEGSWMLGFK